MTIDMKEYSGDKSPPATVEESVNSYQNNEPDFPILEEALPPTEVKQEAPPVEIKEDPQERNFRALSEKIEQLKAEKNEQQREFQLQLDMMRANLNRSPDAQVSKEELLNGMDATDVPNVGEIRSEWQRQQQAFTQQIEELKVQLAHPDYAEVLQKYGKQLAETDPIFVQGLKSADNKAAFAYRYCKREQELQDLRAAQKAPPPQEQRIADAQRIVENSRKPGTLSQAGGQGALSKADYYATMSDREFMELAAKHLESV